jgi:hypothetical protein
MVESIETTDGSELVVTEDNGVVELELDGMHTELHNSDVEWLIESLQQAVVAAKVSRSKK